MLIKALIWASPSAAAPVLKLGQNTQRNAVPTWRVVAGGGGCGCGGGGCCSGGGDNELLITVAMLIAHH